MTEPMDAKKLAKLMEGSTPIKPSPKACLHTRVVYDPYLISLLRKLLREGVDDCEAGMLLTAGYIQLTGDVKWEITGAGQLYLDISGREGLCGK